MDFCTVASEEPMLIRQRRGTLHQEPTFQMGQCVCVRCSTIHILIHNCIKLSTKAQYSHNNSNPWLWVLIWALKLVHILCLLFFVLLFFKIIFFYYWLQYIKIIIKNFKIYYFYVFLKNNNLKCRKNYNFK